MPTARILVVDDEKLIRWALRERLESAGHRVIEAEDGASARVAFDECDLVLLDYKLPDTDGLQLLREFKQRHPAIEVIMMTAHASVQMAVEAMTIGAYHYVDKPFDEEALVFVVARALETSRMRRELHVWRAGASGSFDSVIGDSTAMSAAKALAARVASSPGSTVLLTGESGTGKGIMARAIHGASDRSGGPFQLITCTSLPETLLESELFGHERGAFTDARRAKAGLFELAHGGTLFLDEIGEIGLPMQAKLLRFFEDKTFRRVGGTEELTVDVRVVTATNKDLELAVSEKRFREDLYYRLAVLPIRLPSLRERADDIPALVAHFLEHFNAEFNRAIDGPTPAGMDALTRYGWPGNVRELRNVIERAMILCSGESFGPEELLLPGSRPVTAGFTLPASGIDMAQLERDLVIQALDRCDGNQTRAAVLLGLNRDQIRYRIQKFELPRPSDGAAE